MSPESKTCFFITPIGPKESKTRRDTDALIDIALEPALKNQGFELSVAHRTYEPGSINSQVIEQVINADLVVANLSRDPDKPNPNVMYELALRHAAALPVVTIASEDTELPFDVTEQRTHFFTNDAWGMLDFKDEFSKAVAAASIAKGTDNPVTRAMNMTILKNEASSDFESYVIDTLETVTRRLDTLNTARPEVNWARPVQIIDIPGKGDPLTIQIPIESGRTSLEKIILRNTAPTQLRYTAEVIEGSQFVRIVSYSRFIDVYGVDDQDLLEFEVIAPFNPRRAMYQAGIRITINEPEVIPEHQDIFLNVVVAY